MSAYIIFPVLNLNNTAKYTVSSLKRCRQVSMAAQLYVLYDACTFINSKYIGKYYVKTG